jgi:hypothetical protein
MIISAVLKRGIVWDGKNVDITFDIPTGKASPIEVEGAQYSESINVNVKATSMQITVSKETNDILVDSL